MASMFVLWLHVMLCLRKTLDWQVSPCHNPVT